ncbi:MAG: hypothetical protein ACLFM4_13795 [Phormidium sp.]
MSENPSKPPVEQTVQHSRLIAASPIYYGWLIFLAGSLGMLMTIRRSNRRRNLFGTVSGSFFSPRSRTLHRPLRSPQSRHQRGFSPNSACQSGNLWLL